MPSTPPAPVTAVEPVLDVAVVALPRFTLMVVGCVVDGLRLANRAAGRDLYAWRVVGLEATVVSSTGVTLAADEVIDAAPARTPDVVIVCGGLEGHRYVDRRVLAWLRAVDAHGGITAAVSTGVWSLAHAGLLDGRRCAVHWDEIPSFTARFPRADVRDEIFAHDGRRMSCSGGAAVIDMLLHLVALQKGRALADTVGDLMIHAAIRTAAERQRPRERGDGPRGGIVGRAVVLMEEHVEPVLAIEAIAARLGQSTRQLERLFGRAFGIPPKRYYALVRLRRARKLLLETDLAVTEVAIRCGYHSATQFSAAFKRVYGTPPQRHRSAGR